MIPAAANIGDPAPSAQGCEELVSVVIPTHNRAAVIGRAIRSALAQTYANLEIVVVDDNSSDGTADVLERIKDPRVKVVRCRAGSAAAARNAGIAQARGQFVAFLDSDDSWDSRKIELQLERFRNGPDDLAAVYTGIRTTHPDGMMTETLPEYAGRIYEVLCWRNKVGGASTMMVKRAVLKEVGAFDTRLPACEDWDLWTRIAKKYRIEFVRSPFVHYYADGLDRLSHRSRAVFIANHLIFRRLNGRRPRLRNLSMYLALQSRELYWLGKRRLAVRMALESLLLRPIQRERIALHTLKWALRDAGNGSLRATVN